MGIMEWLTSNTRVILISIAVVVIIIILWKVYFRERLLKTTNYPEKVENPLIIDRPNVVVFLRPHATCVQCLMLCIENIGTAAAYNVQFKTGSHSFLNTSSSNLDNVQFPIKNNFLKRGISCFGPGQKIEQFLINLTENLSEDLMQPFQISVTYTDSLNNLYENIYPLVFCEFKSLVSTYSSEGKTTLESDLSPQRTVEPKGSENLSNSEKIPSQSVRSRDDETLSLELQKLVALYNEGKDSELLKTFNPPDSIQVSNQTERLQNSNIPPTFQPQSSGSLKAYAIESKKLYAVVPFSGMVLQFALYSSGAIGEVFECPGFDPKYKYDIKVIRPAFFKRDPVNDNWTLQEKGILELEEQNN